MYKRDGKSANDIDCSKRPNKTNWLNHKTNIILEILFICIKVQEMYIYSFFSSFAKVIVDGAVRGEDF